MANWKEGTDPFSPKTYTCDRKACGQKSTEPMPKHVCKHVRGDTQDFNFCSQECHDEFYMDRMRTYGL